MGVLFSGVGFGFGLHLGWVGLGYGWVVLCLGCVGFRVWFKVWFRVWTRLGWALLGCMCEGVHSSHVSGHQGD